MYLRKFREMNYYYGMQAFKKYGLVDNARDKEMHEIVR
jgi:hypothetical protein